MSNLKASGTLKMRECLKTGFHGFLLPYEVYIYGDAFVLDEVYIFRICETNKKPISGALHFTIYDWFRWFDEKETSMKQNSTMLCTAAEITYHGHEGVVI